MQASDFERFRAVMAGMAEMYGKDLSTTLLDAYWLALHDWPREEFEKCAARLMQTSEFMPRPSAFHGLRKAGRATAGELWPRAVRIAATGGYRNGERLADEAGHKAVMALGGYDAIGRHDVDTLHFLERRFAEHFETISDAVDTREALPHLELGPLSKLPMPFKLIGKD